MNESYTQDELVDFLHQVIREIESGNIERFEISTTAERKNGLPISSLTGRIHVDLDLWFKKSNDKEG